MTIPKIISVDDHVVEPRARLADLAAREVPGEGAAGRAQAVGAVRRKHPGAKYANTEDPDGEWGDAWIYEDQLIYVQKKFVAIPLSATPDGDVVDVRPHGDDDDRGHLRRDAPRLLRPRRRASRTSSSTGSTARCRSRRSRASAARRSTRPTTRSSRSRACEAYNDWMVEEWCEPSGGVNIPLCLMPLWDVELAVEEIQRNAARGVRAFCFSELPTRLDLPSIHTGYWDPVFAVCNDTGVTLCMHIGSSSTDPAASPDAPAGRRRHARVQQLDGVARRLAVLREAHAVPEAEARVLRGPDRLDPVRARAGRHGVGAARRAGSTRRSCIPEPPSTYYYGRIFGCFTADRHGLANRSTRSARTTSASRPTTRTPTRRGRTRRSTSRRCSPTSASTTRPRTRCCAATRSACSSSTAPSGEGQR